MGKELQAELASFVVDVLLLQQTINFKDAEIQLVKERLVKAAIAAEHHFLSIEQVTGSAELRAVLKVCQEEVQIAHYWLRILREAGLGDLLKTNLLVEKALELRARLAGLVRAGGKQWLSRPSVAA